MGRQQADLVVIGGGPGGYVAAIRGAQLGRKVVLIEEANLGGICLNWGCIPTKALLESAHRYRDIRQARVLGVEVKDVSFDLDRIVKHSRQTARRLSKGVEFLMKKNGISVLAGHGRLVREHEVEVTTPEGPETLEAGAVILATGARPKQIPGLKPDGKRIWTSREALTPKQVPGSLLIIGAGAIGVEFADFYHCLGAEVTLVEMLPRILPVEDEDISRQLEKSMARQGIHLRTACRVQEVIPGRGGVQVRLEDRKGDQDLMVEAVLVAVGVTGNVDGLGLEAMGIRPEKGFVPVNEYQQTSVPSVYAIGDVAGPPWLAHVASAEGHVAAEHAAGKNPRPLRKETIPGCTYCRPEVASVGLTEAIARERFETVNVGRFDFRANGRALAAGEGEGFVKLVFAGPYGELVGAHILGGHATEMIAELATAMTLEATWEEIGSIVHPHPTWSEAVMEAALDARGRAIHH